MSFAKPTLRKKKGAKKTAGLGEGEITVPDKVATASRRWTCSAGTPNLLYASPRRSTTSRQGYRHRDSGAMQRSAMPIWVDHWATEQISVLRKACFSWLKKCYHVPLSHILRILRLKIIRGHINHRIHRITQKNNKISSRPSFPSVHIFCVFLCFSWL